MLRSINMSNVKVRPNGDYLVRWHEGGELEVARIANFVYGTEVLLAGTEVGFTVENFHWIADEPLDLESIRLLMMNDGLKNAVEAVDRDSYSTFVQPL